MFYFSELIALFLILQAQLPAPTSATWVAAAITGLTTIVALLVTQIFGLIGQRDAAKQRREAAERDEEMLTQTRLAAEKAEEVRKTLEHSTADTEVRLQELKVTTEVIKDTTDQVHILVNSRLGLALNFNAKTARILADITKDPRHVQMAEDAEEIALTHERQNAAAEQADKK